jgi:hypothetical protein
MIDVEPLAVCIRAVEGAYGDPYIWSAAGVRIAPGVLEIVGAMTAPPPSVWRELKQTLREQGWETVVFRRMRRGKCCETHTVNLRRVDNSNSAGE